MCVPRLVYGTPSIRMETPMLSNGKLINTGSRLSRAFTGKHQGYVHVSEGVYWEAMYRPGPDELIIQAALGDKKYGPTNQHPLITEWKR